VEGIYRSLNGEKRIIECQEDMGAALSLSLSVSLSLSAIFIYKILNMLPISLRIIKSKQ